MQFVKSWVWSWNLTGVGRVGMCNQMKIIHKSIKTYSKVNEQTKLVSVFLHPFPPIVCLSQSEMWVCYLWKWLCFQCMENKFSALSSGFVHTPKYGVEHFIALSISTLYVLVGYRVMLSKLMRLMPCQYAVLCSCSVSLSMIFYPLDTFNKSVAMCVTLYHASFWWIFVGVSVSETYLYTNGSIAIPITLHKASKQPNIPSFFLLLEIERNIKHLLLYNDIKCLFNITDKMKVLLNSEWYDTIRWFNANKNTFSLSPSEHF